MSRLSFRPRPLDIHKKLPILKSIKDFDDDETPTSTRNAQLMRATTEVDNEVHQVTSKKLTAEIPTPEFVVVDTYERDYSCTFKQPNSYLRGRGARAELGDFIEYDLDNEDEDWIYEFNKEKKMLTAELFECLLFKLEVLDHKARERAGVITPTLGAPIPVLLQLDVAAEALQAHYVKYSVLQSVYEYWREKRERWQKPVLRRLQPPPPVNDTNPYNVFRPREKSHRLHTRRMQRRENNVQSFEKLRQVRRNLDQAKSLLEALIKREEKKRDVMENEVTLQRIQMKYKHETELPEDNMALPGFPSFTSKIVAGEEEYFDMEDVANSRLHTWGAAFQNVPISESTLHIPTGTIKQESRRRNVPHRWLHKLDPQEPVLLFTKPLIPEKLAAAGISPNSDSLNNSLPSSPYKFRGRMGRGGRIIFDRWNPLSQSPIDSGNSYYAPPPSAFNV